MRTSKVVHLVSAHAAGEVGDVIVGGVAPPPGETLWEQRAFIHQDGVLRNFVLNEPRGGVFRHVNILVPAKDPNAQMGFIIMEPADTPPMSGSNSICVATVLLETGILPMREPETRVTLEAPGGLVDVRATCWNGVVEDVAVTNLPSFAHSLSVALDVPGLGTLTVDTAYGGDSFVIVDAAALGFDLIPSECAALAELGTRISAAATDQIGFAHPTLPDWHHYSFCLFSGRIERKNGELRTRHAVAVRPGKIDRSPTGTAVSARLAVLAARDEISPNETLVASSVIGSEFRGRIIDSVQIGERQGIVPEISGRAWITGFHQHVLAPDDPWPEGYRLSDTWPNA